IFEEKRYSALNLGADKLAGRRELALSRAGRLMEHNYDRRDGRRISERLDVLDTLETQVAEQGEDAVVAALREQLTAALESARIAAADAADALRVLTPSEQ